MLVPKWKDGASYDDEKQRKGEGGLLHVLGLVGTQRAFAGEDHVLSYGWAFAAIIHFRC